MKEDSMKKLFFYLFSRYSRREPQRLEILAELQNQVRKEYYEQTGYGNFYNFHTEFILSNDIIKKLVHSNDTEKLEMMKKGMIESYDKALGYIKDEKII